MMPVKQSILIPVRLLALILLFLVVCAGFYLPVQYAAMLQTIPNPELGMLWLALLKQLPALWMAGCLLGAAGVLFTIVRKPGKKLLSFILLWLFSMTFFYSGMGFSGMVSNAVTVPTVTTKVWPGPTGALFLTDRWFLFTSSVEGSKVGTGFVIERAPAGAVVPSIQELSEVRRSAALVRTFEQAVWNPSKGTLETERLSIPLAEQVSPVQPTGLSGFVEEVQLLSAALLPQRWLDWKAIVYCVSIMALTLSAWTLVRATRWPLFNAMLFLLLLRGVLFSFTLFMTKDVQSFFGLFLTAPYAWLAPAILWFACAFALFFVNFANKPLEQWRRDAGYE